MCNTIDAIILAAGKGTRLLNKTPKAFLLLNHEYVLLHSLKKILYHPSIRNVYVTYSKEHLFFIKKICSQFTKVKFVIGGNTRQESVYLALKKIASQKSFSAPQFVIIHDAVRPFVSTQLIDNIIQGLKIKKAVFPGIKVQDSIKEKIHDQWHTKKNEQFILAQTPQAFSFELIKKAHHNKIDKNFPDDIALISDTTDVLMIDGDTENFKITYPADWSRAIQKSQHYTIKTTLGFDVHAFEPGNHIKLCGIKIPYTYQLAGHSDSDVALHAVTDALFSLTTYGDIGQHFPSNNPNYRDIESKLFLQKAYQNLINHNGILQNVDITIIGEKPILLEYRDDMRKSLADILNINIQNISIKATTTDHLGFLGRQEGLAALSCLTAKFPEF